MTLGLCAGCMSGGRKKGDAWGSPTRGATEFKVAKICAGFPHARQVFSRPSDDARCFDRPPTHHLKVPDGVE